MSDIGNMCWGLLDNTNDLADIWINAPWRRQEFAKMEISDLREASLKLSNLVHEMEANNAAYAL